jgi:hypothetical protein
MHVFMIHDGARNAYSTLCRPQLLVRMMSDEESDTQYFLHTDKSLRTGE